MLVMLEGVTPQPGGYNDYPKTLIFILRSKKKEVTISLGLLLFLLLLKIIKFLSGGVLPPRTIPFRRRKTIKVLCRGSAAPLNPLARSVRPAAKHWARESLIWAGGPPVPPRPSPPFVSASGLAPRPTGQTQMASLIMIIMMTRQVRHDSLGKGASDPYLQGFSKGEVHES